MNNSQTTHRHHAAWTTYSATENLRRVRRDPASVGQRATWLSAVRHASSATPICITFVCRILLQLAVSAVLHCGLDSKVTNCLVCELRLQLLREFEDSLSPTIDYTASPTLDLGSGSCPEHTYGIQSSTPVYSLGHLMSVFSCGCFLSFSKTQCRRVSFSVRDMNLGWVNPKERGIGGPQSLAVHKSLVLPAYCHFGNYQVVHGRNTYLRPCSERVPGAFCS